MQGVDREVTRYRCIEAGLARGKKAALADLG
jgi:hypothetical protein